MVCLVVLASLLPFAAITASREIGIILGLFFWIIRMYFARDWKWVRTPLDIPLAIFSLTALLSLITAVDLGYSLSQVRGELLKGILVFYLAVNGLRTRYRAYVVLASLLSASAVMDIYGIIYFFVNHGSLTVPVIRISSLHSNPAELWTYLLQTAPFIIVSVLLAKKHHLRFLLIILLAAHSLCMYMTFSRMAALVLLIEISLAAYLIGFSWKKTLTVFAVALIALVAFFPRSFISINKMESNESLNGKSEKSQVLINVPGMGVERYWVWSHALDHLSQSPFAGLGFGRSSLKLKYPVIDKSDKTLWHSHNTFLSIAAGLGVQGLIVFFWLLIKTAISLRPRTRSRSPYNIGYEPVEVLMLGAYIMFFGYFLGNLTNDMYANDAALLYWLLIGFFFSLKLFAGEAAASEAAQGAQ